MAYEYIELQQLNADTATAAAPPAEPSPTSWALFPYRQILGLEPANANLHEQAMPTALVLSCLTVFILPLYDGPIIYYLRWLMTLLCAYIGPRLSAGWTSAAGVFILGMMINRPLGVCTIALGLWASTHLAVVMTKALRLA